MVKSSKPSRRNGNTNNAPIITQMTAKPSPSRPTKNQSKHALTPPKKGKNISDINISTISPTPKKPLKDFEPTRDDDTKQHFGLIINKSNEEVLIAPLSVPLTKLFMKLHPSWREATQGYEFIDRAYGIEAAKEIDIHLQAGAKLMDEEIKQDTNAWFNLFESSYLSHAPQFTKPNGNNMREFGLNLAASDPLSLFDPSEFDSEGNLFPSNLAVAWLGATAVLGSVHLYYDLQLQKNRIAAQTFDDMHEDNDEYAVPQEGEPNQIWLDTESVDQQKARAFTYSQRLGEDAQDRCLADLCLKFQTFLQTDELDMTVPKWSAAFHEATTRGSTTYSTDLGRELRIFGADLALTSPVELFMAHEWIKQTHLRPQIHAHAWLAAVKLFGPLFHYHDQICEEVVEAMQYSEDDDNTGGMDEETEEPAVVIDLIDKTPAQLSPDIGAKKQRTVIADDASAATAPAGAATLLQQRISGKDRQHQLRYDIRFHVPPSKEADKTMIAAAKKFFMKAKEMDDTLVIYPWFKASKNSKIQETRLIPDKMGAFKTYFHQANPRVDGGFVYMRVWLGHDKDPQMLQDDLKWWMKDQQYGLYPRSVQAETISVIGWLLYSTKQINCASLQQSLEKRFEGKYEVGCRYRMISLGRRGGIPKDQQVRAIHIECDSADQHDLKSALSKIYASAKNKDYPQGIRMRLVPEMNAMISPDTRQNVTRLRVRQDNFQQQIMSATTWDFTAVDFVDQKIGRSLRELIMTIQSREHEGQQLFHSVDETWNNNGFQFAFFPNVETEARSMMMALLPFLVHHYDASAAKWFSASAQRRAVGAEWDPEKGCVKTFDDEAVSWMMTEDGFSEFDKAKVAPGVASETRPNPSNLQGASGTGGLINDQDSVGTFDPNAAAPTPLNQVPAPLATGANHHSLPRVLPASTDSANDDSVNSRSTRSSITASLFSRISQMETTLAKVDQLDSLMTLIANKMGILEGNPATQAQATPHLAPPETVNVQVDAAVPVTQLESATASQSADVNTATLPLPDGGRPLTNVGPPSTPRAQTEIRQSPNDKANADISKTDVGQVG